MIGEVLDSSDNTLDYTDTFEWDVVGNRLETSRDWGDVANDDYTTTYQYDANDRLTVETKDHVATTVPDVVTTYSYDHTQQTGKSVVTDGVPTSNQIFEYDLQGRMASVTNQTLDSGGNVVGVQTTEYEYDTAGNRVVATNTVDANNDGTPESVTRTEYLTDANNPTGYSQVIEETEFDDQGNPTKKVVYTIGHDQISQTVYTHDGTNWDSGETHHFGYDGHGSVRVLYDAMAAMVTSATNNILQLFHFDAHGNLLNMQAVEALTSYLYSGEAFDSNIGQQYLRARWYDATTGRFNRLDPFFGNLSDPQSLHKYLYVHGDPANGVDPSGELLVSTISSIAIRVIIGAVAGAAIGATYAALTGGRIGDGAVLGALYGGLGGLGWALHYFATRTNQPINPADKAQLRKDEPLAWLAAAAYRDAGADAALQEARALGWVERDTLEDNAIPEYFGRVFEHLNGDIVVAYAGTESQDFVNFAGDWLTNFGQGTIAVARQYQKAIIDGKDVVRRFPNKRVRFVGHSLGGGLAVAAATEASRKAVTFNAAGVHSWTVSTSIVDRKIRSYRLQGDPLSALQEAFGGVLMPRSNGKSIWLPTTNHGLSPSEMLSRHSMTSVISGIREMLAR